MADKKAAERDKLIEKLNKDIADHISNLKPKKYEEGWPEDKWEEEMEKHPIFRTKPVQEGEEISPLIDALQQLKYDPDENSPEELAQNYKEDGNENFRLKKYRWAIDCYTEGLKQNCKDTELNVQLYTNRAVTHFHLGNYHSSLNDATQAKILKPTHMKAIKRAALCCLELQLFSDCVEFCKEGIKIEPENRELKELICNAEKAKKLHERNQRKVALEEKKQKTSDEKLVQSIKDRGIKIKSVSSSKQHDNEFEISDLEPIHPAARQKVHLDSNNNLIWPVFFLYPEFGEIDFIQEFDENTRFSEHIEVMFGSAENQPQWDIDNRYNPESLQVYFEDNLQDCLILVQRDSTLKEVLCNDRLWVQSGTPAFIIMVQGSKFEENFKKRYRNVL